MQPQISTMASVRENGPAAWGGVLAMSLSAFVLVASEFMPVSLLTPIAADLRISEGQAGQAIAISGFFALVTSLFISSLAGKLDRKRLLLALTLVMIVSGTIAAFAPNYTAFMAARAFIGVAIGGFWSMSTATAMRLVPGHQVPKALAILNGGNALATVVAPPLGSYLGAVIGWRGAFFCMVPVAALALVWKLASLPPMPAGCASRAASALALFR
ncbi:MAG TPA: MFS transporter, partial [Pseudoduganella sp.]